MLMKILVADDHPIFRNGLKTLIKDKLKKTDILEADHGLEAWDLVQKHNPDMVILDIDMPYLNGIEVCAKIHEEYPAIGVIILTMFKEEEMLRKAFAEGALGYVLKDHSINEIMEAIETVKKRKKYIGPSLNEFIPSLNQVNNKLKEFEEKLALLTSSELKTLKLVRDNYSSKQIADLLFVSPKTVENYRSRICKKLEIEPANNSLLKWVLEHRDQLDKFNL